MEAKVDAIGEIHSNELVALQHTKSDTVEVKIESDSTTRLNEVALVILQCKNIGGDTSELKDKFICKDPVNESHEGISGRRTGALNVSSNNEQTNNLARIKREHTEEKLFSCSICNSTFSQLNELLNHLHIHARDKPYSCSVCGFKASSKSRLRVHKLQHPQEKPYPCSACDYKFSFKSSFEAHMLTHTKEKPFSCSACDYKCNFKTSLKVHMLKHTQEKQFSCSHCDYKCWEKRTLKMHMERYAKQTPSLTTHAERHTKQKPNFVLCLVANSQQGNLNIPPLVPIQKTTHHVLPKQK